MGTRTQNERKFGSWEDLADGGRRYWLDVPGRIGWRARYRKEGDPQERTLRFWQEIYDETGTLVEVHEKYPWIRATRRCRIFDMLITRRMVAGKIAAYLRHEIRLPALVDWAERSLLDDEFEEEDVATLARVVGRLGVADVRAFGLTWEDCEELLRALGYAARVEVVAAEVPFGTIMATYSSPLTLSPSKGTFRFFFLPCVVRSPRRATQQGPDPRSQGDGPSRLAYSR